VAAGLRRRGPGEDRRLRGHVAQGAGAGRGEDAAGLQALPQGVAHEERCPSLEDAPRAAGGAMHDAVVAGHGSPEQPRPF
jgi:hypothetical protein